MPLTMMQRAYCRMIAKWRDEADYRSRVMQEAEIFKYEDMFPDVREIRDRYPDNETLIALLRMDRIPEDTTYDLWKPEWQYAPRPYYMLGGYGYTTALWRQTWHCMGRDRDKDRYVWAQARLGYGIDAQSLKRWTWTTDHTMIADPLELSITFHSHNGGGAMGASVLDILKSRTEGAEEIAAIAERWHLNDVRSRCSCMPRTYDEAPNQRCLYTELVCGHAWWHEPLPDSVIETVKGWARNWPGDEVGRDKATILDGKLATWDEVYSQEG